VIGRVLASRLRIPLHDHTADPFFHLPAWLEGHDVPGGGDERLAGAGVARLMRSTALDLEDAEVPQLDPTFGNEGLDDRVEGALDDVLGLELGQSEVL
jgi:hypothetical protein